MARTAVLAIRRPAKLAAAERSMLEQRSGGDMTDFEQRKSG
jgi:hypothetical protein